MGAAVTALVGGAAGGPAGGSCWRAGSGGGGDSTAACAQNCGWSGKSSLPHPHHELHHIHDVYCASIMSQNATYLSAH